MKTIRQFTSALLLLTSALPLTAQNGINGSSWSWEKPIPSIEGTDWYDYGEGSTSNGPTPAECRTVSLAPTGGEGRGEGVRSGLVLTEYTPASGQLVASAQVERSFAQRAPSAPTPPRVPTPTRLTRATAAAAAVTPTGTAGATIPLANVSMLPSGEISFFWRIPPKSTYELELRDENGVWQSAMGPFENRSMHITGFTVSIDPASGFLPRLVQTSAAVKQSASYTGSTQLCFSE